MKISLLSFAALPLAVRGYNIILTNAEGWATSNIRATYNALTSHNNSVVISAPVQDKSQSSGYDSTSKASPALITLPPATVNAGMGKTTLTYNGKQAINQVRPGRCPGTASMTLCLSTVPASVLTPGSRDSAT